MLTGSSLGFVISIGLFTCLASGNELLGLKVAPPL